jgi:uncharacterized protein (DUF1501 family)
LNPKESFMFSRRDFLIRGAGLGALAVGGSAPSLWHRAASAAEPKAGLPILVVLELNGGNDGLNTVVPHADDLYAKARPTLKVDPRKVLRLDDRVGLHPSMADFKALFDAGDLTVAQNVGYPEPNRSHFRSMEIWHTGVVGPAPMAGWLGRLADIDPALLGCHVGLDAVPLAVRPRKETVHSVANLADFRLAPGASLPDGARDSRDVLAEIQRRIDTTRDRAARLEAMSRDHPTPTPDTLRGRLDTIRALIEQDPKLRVFYTTQSGFDTHASQEFAHLDLLRTVSAAVSGFVADLRARKLDDRVVVLIFSEFGRRVAENAQRGTDHGTAGPVFLAGTPARGGLIGGPPNLADLDEGDLRHSLDFRDVYATVLKRWLGVDPVPILGKREEALLIV